MRQATARIDCWEVIESLDGKKRVRGIIYQDAKHRFTDGEFMVTSEIKEFSTDGKFVETKYSLYELGEEAPKGVDISILMH